MFPSPRGSRSRTLVLACWAAGAFLAFLELRPLCAQDCNQNGAADAEDIAQGTSLDCDGDGVPDKCGLRFPGRKVNATGGPPTDLLAEDLDRDGDVDLVATSSDATDVWVLLGKGNGTFISGERSSAGSDVNDPMALELNGDGRVDLVAADHFANAVMVLSGNGDGSFDAALQSPTGKGPVALSASDWNGDGLVDLVTANPGSDDISMLLGNGDGTFRPPARIAAWRDPNALVASDFNANGLADLIAGNTELEDAVLFPGNGDGTFGAQTSLAPGIAPGILIASDLDADARVDLVMGSYGVWVLLGNGDGTFRDPVYFPERGGAGLSPAHLDGDNRVDLVGANTLFDEISVALGNGDGTLQPGMCFDAGKEPRDVIVADLNGDGHEDLAAANFGSSDITVFRGNGDGTVAVPTVRPEVGPRAPWRDYRGSRRRRPGRRGRGQLRFERRFGADQ